MLLHFFNMARLLFFFAFLALIGYRANSQEKTKKTDSYTIVYDKFLNGKLVPNEMVTVEYNGNIAQVSNQTKNESHFIDYDRNIIVKNISYEGSDFQVKSPFDSLATALETNETEIISGYKCKKVKYLIFSNIIEVWFTNDAPVKGSPSLSYVPEKALVTKSVMNGNLTYQIKSIEKNKEAHQMKYPLPRARTISESAYRALQIKSRYTIVDIFDKEQINFEAGIVNPDDDIAGQTYRFSQGTVILKKIQVPEIKPGGNVFIELVNWSNGDAYDRTGCVFTFSSKKEKSMLDAFKQALDVLPVFHDKKGEKYQGTSLTENYAPPIELMRFFTSFGIGHYNDKRPIDGYNWADSVVYKHDITDLMPYGEKEMWIGVFIGNYDKGGHKVSLRLMYYPPYEEEKTKGKFILPLFMTLNIMEASGQNYGKMFKHDTLRVNFELPENIHDLKLLYTTTGHGGWGNGDEFNPRPNRILIDGKEVFQIVPWRTDCATYRLFNPASGNFGNGMSSSDYSRSNWCPATLTPPFQIPLPHLEPGKHMIEVIIAQGKDEGSSFNHWSVSGIICGNIN